jgi:hypothetical protein
MRRCAVWAVILFSSLDVAVAQPATPDSGRVVLTLAPAESAYVLSQMRLFVDGLQAIASNLGDGRRAEAAEAAASRGAKRNANDPQYPPTLSAKLPGEWRQLGIAMRGGFDGLAQGIADGESPQRALARLGDIAKNCVACHASYRIVETHD